MAQQVVIGIDIGTTSTKAVAFDTAGKTIFFAAKEYPILNPEPDFAEQDPAQIFEAVLMALQSVVAQLLQSNYTLAGVSFSSAMHSLLAVDVAGEPLTNSIIWADLRSKVYADALKGTAQGHAIYLKTGTPLHPMSPLPKLCWLRAHAPEVFTKAYKFIGIKAYVLFKLFGKYKTDYSIASATGLFDNEALQWHADALALAGITANQLPDPVPTTYTFRGLKPAYATLLNISRMLPFVIGASDGCLANLGAGAVYPGDAVVTIGTSGAVRVMAHKPAADAQERIFNYILTPDIFVLGGAVNNGGVALRWFRDNFYKPDDSNTPTTTDMYARLCVEAATIPAGADGLLFLPYLLGERAPIWDADARACFIGAHYTHTRAHFLRALMEGVIFGVYSVGRALGQTTGPVSRIYANGGFSRCPTWVQMLADVFNKEVHLTETAEGSALGAAMMGMYALGMIEELAEVKKMATIQKTFVPNQLVHQQYAQNYALFEALYPKLKDTFEQLQKYQSIN